MRINFNVHLIVNVHIMLNVSTFEIKVLTLYYYQTFRLKVFREKEEMIETLIDFT